MPHMQQYPLSADAIAFCVYRWRTLIARRRRRLRGMLRLQLRRLPPLVRVCVSGLVAPVL